MSRGTILIIDDEDDLRALYGRVLELENYTVFKAEGPVMAFKILENKPVDVIISDVRLEVADGLELIPEYKKRKPFTEIIMLTAYGNIPDGVRSIKSGAFDYLTKGDDNARLIPVVGKAMEKARISRNLFCLEEEASASDFSKIIGESPALKEAIMLAKKVAPSDAGILLTGETGTGKDVFARAIHEASSRSKSAFLALNCSALGKDVLESEMFGHAKGAFTGAVADKKGFFEAASGGTLFLDEVGEMSPELQAKLLRVLETGSYFKLGSTREQQADVRVIAATNRDLLKESEKGNFRLDLYYRLSIFSIHLPPLNAREGDLDLLAAYFCRSAAIRMKKQEPSISTGFSRCIKAHYWKGNLRELRNIMERAVILCEGDTLTEDLLPSDFLPGERPESGLRPDAAIDLQTLERDHIANMLRFTGGNKTKTADILGISIATLYRKIQEYML
jgi:two-component system NtrC family response regulator